MFVFVMYHVFNIIYSVFGYNKTTISKSLRAWAHGANFGSKHGVLEVSGKLFGSPSGESGQVSRSSNESRSIS